MEELENKRIGVDLIQTHYIYVLILNIFSLNIQV